MDLLDRLLGHDRWTTAQFLDISKGLTDAQLDQRFDIGLGTLRETLDHMIFNIAFWTGFMVGQPANVQRDDRSPAALIERHERFYEDFAAAARRARDEQRLDDTFIDHYDYPQTVGGTILQVVLHNVEHRSEVRHILERLGVSNLPDGDLQMWEHETHLV